MTNAKLVEILVVTAHDEIYSEVHMTHDFPDLNTATSVVSSRAVEAPNISLLLCCNFRFQLHSVVLPFSILPISWLQVDCVARFFVQPSSFFLKPRVVTTIFLSF